ncbi:hypothetical protein [Rosistilla oblonga]|uniref:hypothetical protein n=1 Tax=Rosistilla oblonga TaxID=2527990 RepID=UPI003A984EC3
MANTLATRKQSEAIRHQMQVIRTALPHDVDAARAQAHDLLDWRYHMRKNPWPLLTVASIVGYIVVPAKTSRQTVVHTRSAVNEPAPSPPKKSMLGGVMGAVFTLALRSGMTMATRQLSQVLTSRASGFGSHNSTTPQAF